MIAILLAALLAQSDPTPFWMPPPPPAQKEKPPPARKKKPPAKKKPVRVEPLEIEEKPPVVEKRKPARSPEPIFIEPRKPREVERKPARPAEGGIQVEDVPMPSRERAVRQPVTPVTPAPEPVEPAPQAARIPAPMVPPQPAPPPTAAPLEPSPEPVIVEPEAAPEWSQRRWSLSASFGAWGASSSDGSGRRWDLAYGLRFGMAPLDSLEIDVQITRAGGTSGSPFVNASDVRNLAALSAFWVFGRDYAFLLGGGGGVSLSQTHYSLLPSTDPGAVASGLDANAIKSVIEITAGGRARFFRGLDARAEVSAVLRDGRLELLPLIGVGAAF